MKLYYMIIGLLMAPVLAMEDNGRQIELCPGRVAYIQKNKQPSSSRCVFCDEDILAQNYIVNEDAKNDVRIMMNKYPYFPFDQGHHLLVMPISHKEDPSSFSLKELWQQVDTAHVVSTKLYPGSYGQEYVTSWDKLAGQSVSHWHSHIKVFMQPPCSLAKNARRYKNSPTNNMEFAFEQVKSKLLSTHIDSVVIDQGMMYAHGHCNCCSMKNSINEDNDNLVIGRFKYNIVCLSHYPGITGEVSVIPYNHVAALKDLSSEELRENMALSMALLSKLKMYVTKNISDCNVGGNLYAESVGSQASAERQKNHHFLTRVMPRTDITFAPGALAGNGCKLDFDPFSLVAYLKENIDDFKSMNNS